jgi:hypothetical protein
MASDTVRRRPQQARDQQLATSAKELDKTSTPESLQQFEGLDCFLVKQDVEHFEAITGIETENSYQVLGAVGSRAVFGPVVAKESSNFFARMACGNKRPWTIKLASAPHVLIIQRPFKFVMQEVRVFSGPDKQFCGSVKRQCRGFPFQRNFMLFDAYGEPVLELTCPFLSYGWEFTLSDLDGNELGKISKKWAGFMQEMFTDADNFGAGFPPDLPVMTKALVLGAVFLIDFCFFEDNEVQNGRRTGNRGSRRGW